jgi:hypothetical protein
MSFHVIYSYIIQQALATCTHFDQLGAVQRMSSLTKPCTIDDAGLARNPQPPKSPSDINGRQLLNAVPAPANKANKHVR